MSRWYALLVTVWVLLTSCTVYRDVKQGVAEMMHPAYYKQDKQKGQQP